ncbi:MAG: hypothetical protein IJF92_00070 [Bacilli bacterium]|nr:hypothetical protein [Bacilli bacterium]MBQ3307615.1 hypothetical protein [Bacilli bacterium]
MGLFIQRDDGKPVNVTLIQTVVINPEDSTQVLWYFKNDETYIESFSSAASANSRLEEVIDLLLNSGGGGGESAGGVVQRDYKSEFPIPGNSKYIYIERSTGITYYWNAAQQKYVAVGESGTTGTYMYNDKLNSTLGGTKVIDKADLTAIIEPSTPYLEGSLVIDINSNEGMITSISASNVNVVTTYVSVTKSFDAVANIASLPTNHREEVLYYVKDINEFRLWSSTKNAYIEPMKTMITVDSPVASAKKDTLYIIDGIMKYTTDNINWIYINTDINKYQKNTAYKKGALLYLDNYLVKATKDFTSSNLTLPIEALKKDIEDLNLEVIIEDKEIPTVDEYRISTAYKKDKLLYLNNNLVKATRDFTSDSNVDINLAFERDITLGNLEVIIEDKEIPTIDKYAKNTEYKKDKVLYYGNNVVKALKDFTSDNTQTEIIDALKKDVELLNVEYIVEEPVMPTIDEYEKNTAYKTEKVLYYNNTVVKAIRDFTSDNVEVNKEDAFKKDIRLGNLVVITENPVADRYTQNTAYKKDKLLYLGNNLVKALKDFISDNTETEAIDSLKKDVELLNLEYIIEEIPVEFPTTDMYAQDTDYKAEKLLYYNNTLVKVLSDFHSDDTEVEALDSFNKDIEDGNLEVIVVSHDEEKVDKAVATDTNNKIIGKVEATQETGENDLTFTKTLLDVTDNTSEDVATTITSSNNSISFEVRETAGGKEIDITSKIYFVAVNTLNDLPVTGSVDTLYYVKDIRELRVWTGVAYVEPVKTLITTDTTAALAKLNTLYVIDGIAKFTTDNINWKYLLLDIDEYAQDTDYYEGKLLYYHNTLVKVLTDFHSDDTEATTQESFDKDIEDDSLEIIVRSEDETKVDKIVAANTNNKIVGNIEVAQDTTNVEDLNVTKTLLDVTDNTSSEKHTIITSSDESVSFEAETDSLTGVTTVDITSKKLFKVVNTLANLPVEGDLDTLYYVKDINELRVWTGTVYVEPVKTLITTDTTVANAKLNTLYVVNGVAKFTRDNINWEYLVLDIAEYAQDTTYYAGRLVYYHNTLAVSLLNFTSDNTETTVQESFNKDITDENLKIIVRSEDELKVDKAVADDTNHKILGSSEVELNSITEELEITKKILDVTDNTSQEKKIKVKSTNNAVTFALEVDPITGVTTIDIDAIKYLVRVASLANLPVEGSENAIYYIEDITELRIWDSTNEVYIEPVHTIITDVVPVATAKLNTLYVTPNSIKYTSDNVKWNYLASEVSEYIQGQDYFKNMILYYNNVLVKVVDDFTSDDTESTVQESFDKDIEDENLLQIIDGNNCEVPVTNIYDLTSQIDGTTQIFNIDSNIKSTDTILAFYAGQHLIEDVNYEVDYDNHTLTTLLDEAPNTRENKHLYLIVGTISGKQEQENTFKRSIDLEQTNWVAAGTKYAYTISDSKVKATSVVKVSYKSTSVEDALAADIKDIISVSNGQFTIYAESQPSEDISINYIIFR